MVFALVQLHNSLSILFQKRSVNFFYFFSFLGLSNILKNPSSFGIVFFVDRAKDDPGSTQLLVNDSKSVCDNSDAR